MAYSHRSDEDCGIFMKQESVMSLYEPTPMSPTSTKVYLQPTAQDDAQRNNATQSSAQIKRNASYGNLTNETEARVLVLYTGELIGLSSIKCNCVVKNFKRKLHKK